MFVDIFEPSSNVLYYIWGIAETEVDRRSCNAIKSLQKSSSLTGTTFKTDNDHLIPACRCFRRHIEVAIKTWIH